MKNTLFALLLAAASTAPAQPHSQEAFCTSLAAVAEFAAIGKAQGISEERAMRGLVNSASASKVVALVYSQSLSPKDAKAVVHAQCLAGLFR